ncbi:DNA-dependent metalloprotease SPRTN-like [Salvelinus fontinalis]|uniref:DNA-dependent metalloprotease SPRTN-like n=1 Tax=Salvelinus fontinalis TaxID=8038 RepID=UPI002485CFFC|nr:DNA-dependent metalloprotease SPRTN-like [Salvelinus fontinalis]
MDEDFLLAIQLQEQFNSEASTNSTNDDNSYGQTTKKRKVESSSDVIPYPRPSIAPEKPMSIVDESWETLDPSPDVRAMFLEFNETFFWGKLSGVEVKWSPRMTLCAGVCSYEGRGGLCSIRLSEPLLKLRPRRDLVQTLLHEMIHALLFVTLNNRDRDGHGPEFCKHMDRINQATGTKITVYHTFHDEVDLYRQHWWRCDGPCRTRKPYFGYVKRAMNRAPSAQDTWWGDHLRSCGGTYTKVKEPEGYGKKGKKTNTSQGKTDTSKDKKPTDKPTSNSKPSSTAIAGSGLQDIRNIIPFSGKGFLLGGSSQTSSFQLKKPIVNSPTTPFTTPVSPRLVLSPPAQATAKGIDSPGRLGLSCPQKKGSTSTTTSIAGGAHGPFRGPKPPVKKSVSNTKAFVNISGSPVRIYKSNTTVSKPHSDSSDTFKAKTEQRSVQDLFNASGWKSGSAASSSTSTVSKPPDETKSAFSSVGGLTFGQPAKAVSSSDTRQLDSHFSGVAATSKPAVSLEPHPSKYFKGPKKPSGVNIPVSRKRPWEDRTSAHIFDFFQQTIGESSPSTSRSTREDIAMPTTPAAHPAVQNNSASSISLTVNVSCPVCQAMVQESKINGHLDSCLL